MTDVRGAATARASFEPPKTLKVPLFHSVIERLDPERRFVVLDLGAAQNELLELLTGYRCRIDIADIADGAIDALNNEPEQDQLEPLAEAWLGPPRDEPADLILCWDLLNYLKKPAMAALMARVATRARSGALAHALIAYSARTMSEAPARFVPVDEAHLVNRRAGGPERNAPRYSPEDLKLALSDYTTERGVLLSNGMQEFLFRA